MINAKSIALLALLVFYFKENFYFSKRSFKRIAFMIFLFILDFFSVGTYGSFSILIASLKDDPKAKS